MLKLSEIQHHNRHSKRETYGFLSFRFYLSKVAFALGKAELPFYFNALVLVKISLLPVALLILPGPAQGRTTEPDSVQLAIAEVFAVAVNLIRQCAYRKAEILRLAEIRKGDLCRLH